MELALVSLLAIGYFVAIFFAKFGFKGWSYFSVDAVIKYANHNFYILPFILGPISYFVICTYIFGMLGIQFDHLWLVLIAITIIRFAGIVVGSRLNRTPVILMIVLSAITVLIGYGLHNTLLWGVSVDHSSEMLRTVLTVIAALSVYSLFNNSRFGDIDENEEYHTAVIKLYAKYQSQYASHLPKWYKAGSTQRLIFFSIMITEDLNRPKIVRLVENLASFIMPVRSTGIMQVSADELLSNVKSVELASRIIKLSYEEHSKTLSDDYHLVRAVSGDYNGDGYADIVSEVYFILYRHAMSV
jgi:hypothetical protein